MNRREFLKISSGAALLMATTKFGVSKVLADDSKAPVGKNNSSSFIQKKQMEHRNLGNLEVSAIGLGCLPMVG